MSQVKPKDESMNEVKQVQHIDVYPEKNTVFVTYTDNTTDTNTVEDVQEMINKIENQPVIKTEPFYNFTDKTLKRFIVTYANLDRKHYSRMETNYSYVINTSNTSTKETDLKETDLKEMDKKEMDKSAMDKSAMEAKAIKRTIDYTKESMIIACVLFIILMFYAYFESNNSKFDNLYRMVERIYYTQSAKNSAISCFTEDS